MKRFLGIATRNNWNTSSSSSSSSSTLQLQRSFSNLTFTSTSVLKNPTSSSTLIPISISTPISFPSATRTSTSIRSIYSSTMSAPNPTRGSTRGGGRGGGGGGRGFKRGGRGRGGNHGQRSNSTLANSNSNPNSNGNGNDSNMQLDSDSEIQPIPPTTVSSHLSTTTFSSLSVDKRILSSIPFEYMTEVQSQTLGPALSGRDILAQAKTGTGKTLAFLIPSIETICRLNPQPRNNEISVLVLSPTRELALQIKVEAEMLLSGMNGSYGVQHCVGGTNISTEKRNLSTKRSDLLIATPGRLLDHLQNGLSSQLKNLKVLILDEADRMLDMGFKQELEKIMNFLPSRKEIKRQHLLFSATFDDSIHKVSNLDENHLFINTLNEDESNTHQHVNQDYIISEFNEFLPLSLNLIRKEMKENNGKAKIIFFFPTARTTGLAAEVFRNLNGNKDVPKVFEIHSRKSQPQRAKASEEFKNAESGIMFSSDVAARGVDWPGVTAVIQVGLPSSGEQYIHRLGRTARAGKSGHGILILTPSESFFLNKGEMKTLPLKELKKESFSNLNQDIQIIEESLRKVSDEVKGQAYAASLGYYKGSLKDLKWKPETLVSEMNEYAIHALLFSGGDGSIPPTMAKTVGKMGLKGVPGLNIVRELPGRENGGGGGGRGGGGGGRGGGSQRGRGGSGRGGNNRGRGGSSSRGAPY